MFVQYCNPYYNPSFCIVILSFFSKSNMSTSWMGPSYWYDVLELSCKVVAFTMSSSAGLLPEGVGDFQRPRKLKETWNSKLQEH